MPRKLSLSKMYHGRPAKSRESFPSPTNREIILYDIDPIKMVEQRGKSRTSTTGTHYSIGSISVKGKFRLVTIYMEQAAYKKKKSAKTLPLKQSAAHTSETKAGQTSSEDNVTRKQGKVKGKFSLSDMTVYNRTAVLTESTVDKYLEDYAAKSSPNYAQAYAMAAYATDEVGREFIAIITAEQRDGKIDGLEVYDVVHAISGRQKRNGSQADTKSQGVYPIKATKISIADLLQAVNSTHQSILPVDVLEHFNKERNPNGDYSSRVKFSLSSGSATLREVTRLRRERIESPRHGADGCSAVVLAMAVALG